jgi:hypothetical protein
LRVPAGESSSGDWSGDMVALAREAGRRWWQDLRCEVLIQSSRIVTVRGRLPYGHNDELATLSSVCLN